jgi:2-oxoisovalerate dehydrogenase E2 component (dihydrolipoyl transacylase)
MPQLGETVTEGTVAAWLKRPGDSIEKYESFVEVSTDKVNAEVPSPVSGVLREIIVKEGETVPTGAAIAIIDEVGAETTTTVPAGDATGDASSPVGLPVAAAGNGATAGAAGAAGHSNGVGATHRNGNGAVNSVELLRRVSPAVRRLAREHAVDLSVVHGTGSNGRITANDVIAAAHEGPAAVMAAMVMRDPIVERTAPEISPGRTPAAAAAAAASLPTVPAAANGAQAGASASGRSSYGAPVPGTLAPLTPARKIIAQRMVESLANAPHAWTMVEVDVTKLWAWRAKEKDRFARDKGYSLTLLPFFIHATVQALRAHPLLNSRFSEEGILVQREINIGIAVGLDSNLMVPVIRDADSLSIGGLAIAAGKLIEKARSGKLGADELGGGTFTVNNTGANGSVLSKPIINAGQAAIVTMEAVVKRPVVIDDAIAIRSMMNVCLSLDHRVLDGTSANAFLADLKKRLESMGPGGDI